MTGVSAVYISVLRKRLRERQVKGNYRNFEKLAGLSARCVAF
jgi:hypothetical protein